MEILIQATQLILSLSILVVLHELGHFIPAKLFKTRVEKFYLFFDPWFSLFKIKRGDTEYGIGWLPLGGYVKISGMIDESMDKEQMKQPPQPWEFRSKPAWQRLIIMIGGVTVNVLLGFLIYIMITFAWGDKSLPAENAKYGIACDSVALNIGLKDGDKIIGLDNKKVEDFSDISHDLLLNGVKSIQVDRNGQHVDIAVPETFIKDVLSKRVKQFISPRFLFEVDKCVKNSGAEKAGLMPGDKMISVNDSSAIYFDQFGKLASLNKNKLVAVTVDRNGERKTFQVKIDSMGKAGIFPKSPENSLEFKTTNYSFIESVPKGIERGVGTLVFYVKQFKLVFTKEGISQIGGFGSIGSMYSPQWDWPSFWGFTAFLSMVLAFMNILPIPALDGGHVMFLLYEIITRRKPNEKAMEYAQYAGMMLLLALLLYANGNDVMRIFNK